MSDGNNQVIYKQLLDRHGSVEIPMIQRDFAQGRTSAGDVRDEFLGALEKALLEEDFSKLPLNLDFVYGSIEGEQDTEIFAPLDGQQRLTTLFLLHWYFAWCDERHADFVDMFVNDDRSRFTYRVRPSSTEFFDELVGYVPDVNPTEIKLNLSKMIADQPWYFRSWRYDPTIQSALTMLDSIHQRFSTSSGLFARMIDEVNPAITFQLLPLKDFGLSDDLYIKMNARGVPLTPFENFKARYGAILKEQFGGHTRSIGDNEYSIKDFVARRVDTAWTDLFWNQTVDGGNRAAEVDVAIFNLFRAVALVTRDPESDNCVEDARLLMRGRPGYTVFNRKGWLDEAFTSTLIPLMETWCGDNNTFEPLLPSDEYFDEVRILKKLTSSSETLEVTEAVQFLAYAEFIKQNEGNIDANSFQEWMRVVRNLVINSDVDRFERLPNGFKAVVQLIPKATEVLPYLSTLTSESRSFGFTKQQFAEEILKAKLILSHDCWRVLIDRAEGHGYFRGQIGFLLYFCEATETAEANAVKDWPGELHEKLQESFLEFLVKSEAMFVSSGLSDIGDYRWQRALLTIGDYFFLSSNRRNHCYLVDSSTEVQSWKRLLRGGTEQEVEGRDYLHDLLFALKTDLPFPEQLDQLIERAKDLQPWEHELVQTPAAFEYCQRNSAIRFDSETSVYLLKTTQMNGTHAELFTFCLHENKLKPLDAQGGLAPLSLEYISVKGKEFSPRVQLTWSHADTDLTFDLEWRFDEFYLEIDEELLLEMPDVSTSLRDDVGFESIEGRLRTRASSDTVLALIERLRVDLAEFSGDNANA